ncbi:DUF5011 domain-containing protein [Erwinia sp. CPCC 100877]|nr:DUF5011 domain-containing protein [Erwinia sp. CPCC 100877]
MVGGEDMKKKLVIILITYILFGSFTDAIVYAVDGSENMAKQTEMKNSEASNSTLDESSKMETASITSANVENKSTISTTFVNENEENDPNESTRAIFGDYEYEIVMGEIKINNYLGAGGTLELPNSINGIPVTTVAANAFNGKSLTSLVLPDSITTIGDYAFANNQLRDIKMSTNSVTYGVGVFSDQHLELTYDLAGASKEAQLSGMISYIGNAMTGVDITLLDDSGVTFNPGLQFYIDGSFIIPEGVSTFNFAFTSFAVSGIAPQGQYSGTAIVRLSNSNLVQLNVVEHSTIYVGDSWSSSDNFISGMDEYGQPLDFSVVEVYGSVDSSVPGKTLISYRYKGKEAVAEITVLESLLSIEGKDSTLYVGDNWTAADNFVSATDKTGAAVDFTEVEVNGEVDTNTAGTYEITYSYGGKTAVATITVKEDQTAIEVKDSNLYVGDNWTAIDNFVSATDKTGAVVDFTEVEVNGEVDTNTAGTYEITYSYGGKTAVATITVKEDQTAIEVKDSNLYVGDNWTAIDNFVSATDKTGAVVDFTEVEVNGEVDTNTAGTYEITYGYGGKTVVATITVAVLQQGRVTIHYVDDEGEKIHENQIIIGNIGTLYDLNNEDYLLMIEGYHLNKNKIPLNLTGSIGVGTTIVTLVYTKDQNTHENQGTNSSIEKDNTTNNDFKTQSPLNKTSTKNEQFPKAGENSTRASMLLLGLLLVVLPTVYFIKRN